MRYLRSIATEFEGEGAAHLSKAADLYKEILANLEEGREDAEKPNQGEPWTKELRQIEAEVLRQALALERRAVDELEAALKVASREL